MATAAGIAQVGFRTRPSAGTGDGVLMEADQEPGQESTQPRFGRLRATLAGL